MLEKNQKDLVLKPLLVLIIDPSPMMREALKVMLNRISSTHITVEIEDIDLTEHRLQKYFYPDLIIYTLYQIDDLIINKLGLLKTKYPQAKLLVTSSLPKNITASFCTSVNAQSFFQPSTSLDHIYAELYQLLNANKSMPSTGNQHSYLSSRQIQILKLIEQGLANEEIAKFLKLEIGTVKTHLTRIFKILHVKSRSQAVFVAKQKNLL